MECKFYMHKVFLLLRYRFVKCWRFVKSWRIVKGWRLRLYFFLVSFSQGHFSHVLPKRWEWWIWWTLKRDKRYGQDAAVCSHLAGFGCFFSSWEMQRYGNILAEGWGPGLRSLSQYQRWESRGLGAGLLLLLLQGEFTAMVEFSSLLLLLPRVILRL